MGFAGRGGQKDTAEFRPYFLVHDGIEGNEDIGIFGEVNLFSESDIDYSL